MRDDGKLWCKAFHMVGLLGHERYRHELREVRILGAGAFEVCVQKPLYCLPDGKAIRPDDERACTLLLRCNNVPHICLHVRPCASSHCISSGFGRSMRHHGETAQPEALHQSVQASDGKPQDIAPRTGPLSASSHRRMTSRYHRLKSSDIGVGLSWTPLLPWLLSALP